MPSAQYTMNLDWKEFSVSLDAIEAWMKANAGSDYCGSSASIQLSLHFNAQPSDDAVAAIEAYWSGLNEESSEATSYQSAAQIKASADAAKATALASALSKLEVLGLTQDELNAMLDK